MEVTIKELASRIFLASNKKNASRPLPRLYAIVGLALLAWAIVIGIGWLIWQAFT